jgi:hypothetical protein
MNREKNKQTCTFQYRALSGTLQKSKNQHRNQIKSSKVSIQSSYKRRSVAKFILQHQEARTATEVEERDTAHSGDSCCTSTFIMSQQKFTLSVGKVTRIMHNREMQNS